METVRVEGKQLRRVPEATSSSAGQRTKVISTVDGAGQRGGREAVVSGPREVSRYYSFSFSVCLFLNWVEPNLVFSISVS